MQKHYYTTITINKLYKFIEIQPILTFICEFTQR